VGQSTAQAIIRVISCRSQPFTQVDPNSAGGLSSSLGHKMTGIFKIVSGFFTLMAVLGIVLMLIGNFTVEWTCHERGSDWSCIGPYCNTETQNRPNEYSNGYACERTDWPMRILEKMFSFLTPNSSH